jgi:hypothetical protein
MPVAHFARKEVLVIFGELRVTAHGVHWLDYQPENGGLVPWGWGVSAYIMAISL